MTVHQYEEVLDPALRELDSESFLPAILGRLRVILDAEVVTVFLADDKSLELYAHTSVGMQEAVDDGLRIRVGHGVAGAVQETCRTRVVQGIDDSTVANHLLVEKGVQSMVAAPVVGVRGAGRPMGVLEVGWTHRDAPGPQEVRLIEVVADQVGMALERAPSSPTRYEPARMHRHLLAPAIEEEFLHAERLLDSARRGDTDAVALEARAHVQKQVIAVNDITRYEAVRDAALGTLPMDKRLASLLDATRVLLGCDVAAVLLMDPEAGDLWPRASVGFTTALGMKPVAVTGSVRDVVALDEHLLLSHVEPKDPFRVGLIKEGVQSLVAVPLHHEGRAQGVVFCGARADDRFTERDVELLALVADQMGTGLERSNALASNVRKRQEAQRASQFKSDLLNMATHDLKTPLQALAMQLQLIGKFSLSKEERQRAVDVMQRNVGRLSAMLDDFLDMARIEADRLVIQPSMLAVDALLQEAVETMTPAAQAKGITLDVAATSGAMGLADRGRMQQVVANLLANAIRYSPDGSTVQVGSTDQETHIDVFVKDHGIGLSPGQMPLLFKPFSQVHGIAAESQGTGLGLYLSQAIVKAHGGELRLESQGPGKGTSAVFTLPTSDGKPSPPG